MLINQQKVVVSKIQKKQYTNWGSGFYNNYCTTYELIADVKITML